jgi:NADH:ubiquinone oxidoreductase subunit 4 (subunit M)
MSELNVGNLDRALRLVAGLVLVVLASAGVIGYWGYIGVILMLTGMAALCPLYALLGIRTTSR